MCAQGKENFAFSCVCVKLHSHLFLLLLHLHMRFRLRRWCENALREKVLAFVRLAIYSQEFVSKSVKGTAVP